VSVCYLLDAAAADDEDDNDNDVFLHFA